MTVQRISPLAVATWLTSTELQSQHCHSTNSTRNNNAVTTVITAPTTSLETAFPQHLSRILSGNHACDYLGDSGGNYLGDYRCDYHGDSTVSLNDIYPSRGTWLTPESFFGRWENVDGDFGLDMEEGLRRVREFLDSRMTKEEQAAFAEAALAVERPIPLEVCKRYNLPFFGPPSEPKL
ncbi:hypothetical protein DFS34DRAFT_687713 [Phlyctochytrium arcticum]|nr:hypothetical protein DFS34DRAFT_687713 [Phlyctochytrium arcticum]